MVTSLTNVNLIYHHTDGEGRSVRRDRFKQTNGYNTFEKSEYSIYSSVLGKALTEVKSDGAKKKTSVYGAGGQLVATQNAAGTTLQHVVWNNIDPASASYLPTLHGGGANYLGDDGQAELDPLGSNVQTSNPFDQNRSSNLMQMPGGGGGWGDPFGGYSCMVDWVSQPCSYAAQVLGSGAGDIGPLDQYQFVRYNGKDTIAFYRLFGDGYAGYVPNNATYIGNGFIKPTGYNGPTLKQGGKGVVRDTNIANLNGVSGRNETDLRNVRDIREFRNIYPFNLPSIKLNDGEIDRLRGDVKTILSNDDCFNFITDLLITAAFLNAPAGPGANMPPNMIVSTDVLGLFDDVRNMGGFFSSPLSDYASTRGNIPAGTATVYMGVQGYSGGLSGTEKRGEEIRAALNTIHELIHFNFDEGSLARAVASMKGEDVPTGGLVGASNYWSRELNNICLNKKIE